MTETNKQTKGQFNYYIQARNTQTLILKCLSFTTGLLIQTDEGDKICTFTAVDSILNSYY